AKAAQKGAHLPGELRSHRPWSTGLSLRGLSLFSVPVPFSVPFCLLLVVASVLGQWQVTATSQRYSGTSARKCLTVDGRARISEDSHALQSGVFLAGLI